MKIIGHIIEVSDDGDTITAKMQGQAVRWAEWRDWLTVSFKMPTSATNQKTYHLGRHVEITVKPR